MLEFSLWKSTFLLLVSNRWAFIVIYNIVSSFFWSFVKSTEIDLCVSRFEVLFWLMFGISENYKWKLYLLEMLIIIFFQNLDFDGGDLVKKLKNFKASSTILLNLYYFRSYVYMWMYTQWGRYTRVLNLTFWLLTVRAKREKSNEETRKTKNVLTSLVVAVLM